MGSFFVSGVPHVSNSSRSKALHDDYEGFVEKFRPKLTTDDCYTPPEVYDVVAGWVAAEYGLERASFVRPFWPGGDYEGFEYPDGCAVVDNPPFSILSKIVRFYLDRGIRFFLFCPMLTAFSAKSTFRETCHVVCSSDITYENGAKVHTSFVTDLEPGVAARTAPALSRAVNEASAAAERARGAKGAAPPSYSYPPELLTSARLAFVGSHGEDLRVMHSECEHVFALDSQRAAGKSVFGGGLLLSPAATARRAAAERAAAERAAAERAAATKWPLSERERALCASLGAD